MTTVLKNDAQLTCACRKYRNKVTRIIEKAKDLDMFNSFEHIVDNPKKVWCKINTKFLHKKHCGSALPSAIVVGENHITDKSTIANKLNEHFANKGHILASKLPEANTSIFSSMKKKFEFHQYIWKNVNVQELLDIMHHDIIKNISPGFDNVLPLLIKWLSHIIALHLYTC